MDPIGTLFTALLGVAMVGGWIGLTRHGPAADHRHEPTSRPTPPQVNAWTGKPVTRHLPRISRRGLGSRLAQTPARGRRWSAFVYPGMWARVTRR
jgi:hypothetical protein